MNQSPDQPDSHSSGQNAHTPNNIPPTVSSPLQPGTTANVPGSSQPGNYPPPTGHLPQAFPAGYPPQQPMGNWPQAFPAGTSPQAGQRRRRKLGWIIGGISAVVVILILVIVLIPHGFSSDPPSSWLSLSNGPRYIDFVHWTNQKGQLNGSWDETDGTDGLSNTYDMDGSYNYQNHDITLNIRYPFLGRYVSLYGNIQDNTMTLHKTVTSSFSPTYFVFHSASQQDYDNAKQHPSSTPT